MKKLSFVLFLLLQLLPIVSRAATEINGIYYNLDSSNKTAEVTLSNPIGSVSIPKSVSYNGVVYSVTSIGKYAFRHSSGLTSLIIPNSVNSIGDYAFYLCDNLTHVTISSSVSSIGNYVFQNCSGLSSIVVDALNSKYDSRDNCNAIIETSTNTLIAGCKNTVIPNSVTAIGNSAFRECGGLTTISIPNSIMSIADYAFYDCYELGLVSIPANVTSIGNYAFQRCGSLTSIVVDAANNKYDSRDNCNAIIETSTNTLIVGCKNTVIPNSVTCIYSYAFEYCSGLTSVMIPPNVTNIGVTAFQHCRDLTTIIVNSANWKYDSRDNCNAIIETESNTLIVGCKNSVIPKSVTSIGHSAFYGCSGLNFINIPNSVTSIGHSAFWGCGLTTVTIPNSVTSIEKSTFYQSNLSSVSIPNSVTSIGDGAFRICNNLKDVFCYAKVLPTATAAAFNRYNKTTTLHVPASAIDAYRTTAPWSGFGTIVPIEEDEDDLQSYLNSLEDSEDSFDGSTYRREFKSDDWQALYVPFEMNYSDWSAEFDVAEIKGLRKYDGYIALEASIIEDGKLEANYPYLIRAKSERGATLTVNVTGEVTQVINSVSCKKLNYWEGLGLEIKGNYSKMTGMKSQWYHRMQGGTLSVSNSNDEVLQPYRWYGIPTNTASRELRINIEDEEVTAISNAAAPDTRNAPAVYDLQGRKMNSDTQLKSGIYIINGKKHIIK